MSREGLKAIGVLALAALAGCDRSVEGDDPSAACKPSPFEGTCVAEVVMDFRSCYDGEGRCTWSESRPADSLRSDLVFEWENGARLESTANDAEGLRTTIEAASGKRCSVVQIKSEDCRGFRTSSGERWYEYCSEFNEGETIVTGRRYECDDGEVFSLSSSELAPAPPMCSMDEFEPLDDCVNEAGRRYGDVCGDTFCFAGTDCIEVLENGAQVRMCLRRCRSQVDCESDGSRCRGATDDNEGHCYGDGS